MTAGVMLEPSTEMISPLREISDSIDIDPMLKLAAEIFSHRRLCR